MDISPHHLPLGDAAAHIFYLAGEPDGPGATGAASGAERARASRVAARAADLNGAKLD